MRFDTPYNQRETPPHRQTSTSPLDNVQSGARKWNTWWSRRSPNIITNDNNPHRIGIDVGSKTVKLVALDRDGGIVFALYHRHRSDVRTTLAELLHDVIWRYGDMELPVAITGSAGIALADELGLPFVQEVVATASAVKARYPQADCIIELGGEDAKITYLAEPVEQRMNATCAGGTGDFIDGIAGMLGVKTREFSKLALGAQRTYDIASRCAVFAQTDVRPLINAGARKADIAQSTLEAVVRQTLGGLACGRPIRGNVVFLGGPLEHIPALVMTFRRNLGLTKETGIKPPDAHLFTAIGAIETAVDPPAVALSELERRISSAPLENDTPGALAPLFENIHEQEEFRHRHVHASLPVVRLGEAGETLFLGFDAGSTTCKYAVVDENGTLVVSDYRNVEGDTFATAKSMLEGLLVSLQSSIFSRKACRIAQAAVTGYGEDLLRCAFGFDDGIVETVAHLRGAQQFCPDASFVLDIGGQDMKALWIRDGIVVDAVLNEACSSGCGAFVQSSVKSLRIMHSMFSQLAFEAKHPIDLGAKCTVFMASRVRHAQKIGSSKADIAAGIAYSVVKNVMTRIIGKSHALPLGDSIVVQGGAFRSDAVLRAFEKTAGVQAIRPNMPHLMGAYGAALIARDNYLASRGKQHVAKEAETSLISLEAVRALDPRKKTLRCTGCGNGCLLSVMEFDNDRRFVSGNRCERAFQEMFGEPVAAKKKGRNLVALEQRLVEAFATTRGAKRENVTVGLMNAMNLYESTPFWHTLLADLGFGIIMPDDEAARPLRDKAAETVPSESVCYPAKVAHVRYAYLIEQGADLVFMPQFERGTRCPVACSYPQALRDNVANPRLSSPVIRAIKPEAIARRDDDKATLLEEFNSWAGISEPITEREFENALMHALAAQERFEGQLQAAADDVLEQLGRDVNARAAILAGRPYHADPTLLHGIDRELAHLGFAVIPPLAIRRELHALRNAKSLWKPSKHLRGLVEFVADKPQIEIVALRSFGCLYDAVSFDEARELANETGRPFTELKIDDIADTAHVRIRLRTLAYTSSLRVPGGLADRSGRNGKASSATADATAGAADMTGPAHDANGALSEGGATPTPDLCSTAKALVNRALAQIENQGDNAPISVPDVCRDCLVDALPFEVKHVCGKTPELASSHMDAREAPSGDSGPLVGLLGNPLLVFDDELNEGIAALIGKLGWRVVYPDLSLIETEDVRYLEQLEAFEKAGVQRVIYLQSFGCLKGHVQSRGAAHEIARLFPNMPMTVIDYDAESSALNRENRIRLALS